MTDDTAERTVTVRRLDEPRFTADDLLGETDEETPKDESTENADE